MQTTPKANNILGHFFALLGAVVMLAIGTWVSASSSQQVQPLDNLAVPRTGHTATALSDGRILITGGRDAAGNLVAASEIFDPETQTSSAIAALHTARVDHSATVLADSRVLVAGGTGANGALSSSEIFDPGNPGAGFQVVASPMTAARTHHTATLLNNGSVLIAGGETGGTAEIFDPTTQSFTPTLWNLQVARNGHTATLFTDDSVLLAGGNTNSMELFTPLDQKFTLDVATMSVVRTGHWAFELSDTRLLLFQGDTGNTIDEFNPTTDILTPKGSLDFHASSSSLLANGKVLVLGTDVSGLYNPDAVPPAPDFTAFDETLVPHSGILQRSGQAAVQLPGDKQILITGGVDGDNQLLGQALFNPAKIWTDKDDYVPDEPVILSASGWKANEAIYLFAVDNETEQWTYEMTVNADSNGEFVLSPYFIVELRHLGVQFHVTALGAQSTMQADVFFTDAGVANITVAAQTPSPVVAGNTATYTATVHFNGTTNTSPCPVTLSASPMPAGATATFGTNPVTGQGGDNLNSTLTISTTAGTTLPNTYNFTITGTRGAACQGGGAEPTVATTLVVAAPATTTTAVTSSVNPSTYGGPITFTATVTSTSTPTGSVNFNIAGIGIVAGTPGATTATTATWTYTTSTLNAGNHTASASFVHTGSFGDSSGTLSGGQNVNKANATVVVTPYNVTYDGSAHTATVTSITGVNGETGATVGTVTLNTTHTNAATYSSDTWTFTGTANYNNIAATTITDVINKATPTATLAVSNSPQTYTGLGQAATVSITTSSVPGAVANILTGGAATKTNAGTYAVTADFVPTDTTNYNTLTGLSAGNFVIQKATPTATLAVTNSPQTYTGSPQAATVGITVSSVPGAVANILTGGAATKTNAGTYAVTADFVPTDTTNYNTLTGLSAGNFVIQKATPTATLAVSNSPQTYTGLGQAATVSIDTSSVPGTVANILTGGAATKTNAGTYAVTADFVPTDTTNYNTLTGVSAGNFVINKANATFTVTPYTCPSTTYTGSPHTATVSTITGVNGETGITVGTVNLIDTMHTNVGIYNSDPWTFTGTANYNDSSGTVDDCIAKADATVVVTPYTCPTTTYTGLPHTATYTISGVNGESGAAVGTINVSGTTHTPAGTYNNDPWSFTGGANYNDQSGTVNDCIAKADAAVVVTPYTCPTTTYTGVAHTATYTITGVNGETGATVGTINVSSTSHTAAGTYNNDPWSFTGGANYNDKSGTVNDCIAKAAAVVVVTPYTCPTTTYTGVAHTATYTITGVNGETGATVGTVNVSGTSHTAAGTYNNDPWSFTGTANYEDQNGTVNDCIAKAAATVVVTPYTCPATTYTGLAHTATYTITGVNGETGAAVGTINVSGTTHTPAGTYNNDPWSFTGGANYEDQNGTVDDCIAKANATVVVTAYSVTYDSNPHTATYTISGVNGETGATVGTINVGGTTHTDAGTYNNDPWSFTGGANYNDQNGTVDDFIDKANATVVVTAYSVTFDANPHTATYTVTGVGTDTAAAGSSINVSGTTHTGAGTYNGDPWSFNGGANYNNQSGTVDDFIGKANATVVVTAYSVTFDANPHTATYTVTGVGTDTAAAGSSINVSGTTHTGAGTYNGDPWSFNGGTNYNNQNGIVDDFIGKANATVVVTAYSVTFDANPHTATYTITGVGTDTAAAGSSIDVSSTTHTGAGTYNGDPWSFNGGTNYNNQNGIVDDFIGKANATVVVTAYSVTYDSNPHTATYTITGVGTDTAAAGSSIDVSSTTHTGAGTYNGDPWSFTGGANYNDQNGTVDDFIGKADATVVVTAYSVTFDADPHTATYTVTGVGSDTAAAGSSIDVSGTTHTGAGTYNGDAWSFNGGTNYNNQSGTVDDFIGKANATVVVTAYSVTFDANPHTATYTVTGVGSDTAAAGSSINVSGTTHTGAGTYNGDAWSFNGGANYNNQSGTVDDFIGKANATVVVTAYSVTFDANPHTATYTVTGVGSDTAAAGSSINVSGTTHTGAGTYNGDAWSFNGGANYNNQSGTVDDFIGKANATVVVTAYSVTFDANPHTATYTVTGVGTDTAAAGSSINVSGTTHTGAGTYNGDPWSFNGGTNYNNQSGTVDDAIAKANATVVVTAYNVTYNGMPRTATYTITGVGTDTGAAGSSINVTGTTHTNAGTYNGDAWSFNGGTNYNNQNGTVNDLIGKANATFTVTLYNVAFDNNPHTATVGTITGVNGETGATVGTINLSGTTHTLPADYPSDPWTFTGTANYNNQNGTVHDIIHYGTTCTGSDPGGVILPPINSDGSSVYKRKGGSTIPVKFKVCDASGNSISNPYAVFLNYPQGGQLTMTGQIRGTIDNVNETGDTVVPDVAFTFTGGQWHFNMDTGNLTAGQTYTFRINLAFGPGITFTVGVK